MTNFSLDAQVADAESLEGYRYLVWMEFEALWKEQDPMRRANLALSLAEYTATLARLEVEEAQKLRSQANSPEAA